MDELEISGKRYISTRLAAKQHKYHSDYIGQLVRGGKVAGQKVGRAWYVDAASLDAYLNAEGGEQTPVTSPTPVMAVKKVTPVPEPVVEVIEEKVEEEVIEETPLPEVIQEPPRIIVEKRFKPEHIKPIAATPLHADEDEEHAVPITKVMPRRSTGLRYIQEEPTVFPAIKKSIKPRVTEDVLEEREEEEEREQEALIEKVEIRPQLIEKRRIPIGRVLSVVGVGVVIFVITGFLSSKVVSVLQVEEGQPAATHYSLE